MKSEEEQGRGERKERTRGRIVAESCDQISQSADVETAVRPFWRDLAPPLGLLDLTTQLLRNIE